ncbi:MAG: leucine-rich repeat domain-containing protein [Treponema sp.]|jgi:hypothetical protein|nr:leucine-rich repeat domain-containing protein [Treponema sp.]
MMKHQIPIRKKYGQESFSCGLHAPHRAPAVLAVVLALLYVEVFTACSDDTHQEQKDTAGRVLIRIAPSNQRTVYPDTGGFVKFTLLFTGEDGKSAPNVILENKTSVEIRLDPGKWIITATGWIHSGDSSLVPAACGKVEVTVIAGKAAQAEIMLDKPATESGMDGTFTWRVQFPADAVESGHMRLSVLRNGMFSPYDEVDILEQREGGMSLPPGYYLAEVTLSAGGAEAGRSEVMYIYPGLTTALPDMAFTSGDFPPRTPEPDVSTLAIGIGIEEAVDIRGLPPEPVILTGTGAAGFPSTLSLTITDFTWIECRLDGEAVVPEPGEGNAETTFFINAQGLHGGRHFLSFVGVKNGVPHGREIVLSVDPPPSIDSVESLAEMLAALPPNTQEHPYRITMNGVDVSAVGKTGNTLRTLYDALNRYVALDLTGSGGDKFASISLETAGGKGYIVSIVLPPSVTEIATNAFQGCATLVSVEMPGVRTVRQGAFDGCTNLESASLPETTEIVNTTQSGHGAFYNCGKLTSVYVPKVITIGHRSFSGCTTLTTISLPCITQIDEYAFKNCKSLVTAYIPESAVIAGNAFEGCTALAME